MIGCRHDFYVSDLKPVLTMFAELRITEMLFSVGGGAQKIGRAHV